MEAGPRESNGRTEGIPRRRPDEERDAGAAELDRDVDGGVGDVDGSAGGGDAGLDEVYAGQDDDRQEADDRGESYAELRPARRLRLTQFTPIVLLGLLGSLMFAFPLAFAFDETGAAVAMLGLLLGCSAAGWGMMAARRVGYTWPGLPPRDSGRRPDWRPLALYGLGLTVLVALAVWRVAALR